MLTPRHQALVATLAGMTVGVAVFGTVLAINSATGNDSAQTVVASPTPTPSQTTTDGLQPGALQFVARTFGSDRSPVTAEVPSGWKSSQSGTRPRFVDATGVWQVRFDARGSKQTPAALLAARQGSIDEPDYKVLSTENTTLVYTYTDTARGPRMGLSRWIPAGDSDRSAVEITVGGRPQDEAGLRAVLERATDSLQLPSSGDNRPS